MTKFFAVAAVAAILSTPALAADPCSSPFFDELAKCQEGEPMELEGSPGWYDPGLGAIDQTPNLDEWDGIRESIDPDDSNAIWYFLHRPPKFQKDPWGRTTA